MSSDVNVVPSVLCPFWSLSLSLSLSLSRRGQQVRERRVWGFGLGKGKGERSEYEYWVWGLVVGGGEGFGGGGWIGRWLELEEPFFLFGFSEKYRFFVWMIISWFPWLKCLVLTLNKISSNRHMRIRQGLSLLGQKLKKEGKGNRKIQSPIRILQYTLGLSGTFVSLLCTFASLLSLASNFWIESLKLVILLCF